jgi:hypothetical protein
MTARHPSLASTCGALILLAAFQASPALACQTQATASDLPIELNGLQSVPAVSTLACGHSLLEVRPDRSLIGEVLIEGLRATSAHLHEGAPGSNGKVLVALLRFSDHTFIVPPETRLSEAQYASFLAGRVYVNVHSTAYPEGEIRAQLKPD